MIVKIIRTGLRPVRDNVILWESDRLREIDRDLYRINCRVMDLELEVRGRFSEFDRDLNREVPDHILIDRLYKMMSRYDQGVFDRHHREESYYDYYSDDDKYYNSSRAIRDEISRGISEGISDAFAGIGERVSDFIKEQENATPAPTPTPTPTPAPPAAPPAPPTPAPAAATQSDVAALQAQLAALQQQLAALQTPATPPPADGGTK